MNFDSQNIGDLAAVATALAVVIALIFGVVQIRQTHRKRRDATTFEFINSFQSPHFLASLHTVMDLPARAPLSRFVQSPTTRAAADELSNLFESMGYMVHQRLIPLHVVDDLIGGGVRMCHSKLETYLASLRSERSPTYYEWFTWLNDQLVRHGRQDRAVPAQEKFADWVP